MQVVYSALATILLGFLLSKVEIFRLRKLDESKYFILVSCWFCCVLIIDNFFDPEVFYSNDQKVFMEALISFDLWLKNESDFFDPRYLSQTLVAFVFYKDQPRVPATNTPVSSIALTILQRT